MRGEMVTSGDEGQRRRTAAHPAGRWGPLNALLGLLVWYPGGGWPGSPWWGLGGGLGAVGVVTGYVVVLGSTASATAASLVVRDRWTRVLVLLVAGAAWWLLVPTTTEVAHESAIIGGLLVAGQVAGFALGSLLRRGLRRAAWAVAVVAGLASLDRYAGWLVVLALLLCAASVAPKRPPTLLAAASAAIVALGSFLGTRLLAFALVYGWGEVRRGSGYPNTPGQAVAQVLEPMADFLRSSSTTYLRDLVTHLQVTLLVGLVAALVLAVARHRGLRLPRHAVRA
ncbi:MAG: hypothetical protein M3Y71_07515 [Actinomycetota bacterium]|nr:hypothetical protein [Actinomycetota bacterium]